jgi:hypothetical protein
METFMSLLSRQMLGRAWIEFPNFVARSHLDLWRPGNPIPPLGEFLLLGVSVASRYDLRLLDALDTMVSNDARQIDRVAVFDWTDLNPYILAPHLPNLGTPTAHPLACIWIDGNLWAIKWGYDGRRLVCDRYGLSFAEIDAN